MAKKPSTLSFALLGLLSEAPKSAYDLAKQVETSIIRGVWPSATSHTYAQVKHLVDWGYASVSEEHCGGRKRSVYQVTPLGMQALRDWIKSGKTRQTQLESEALLKFLFCDSAQAGDETLLKALEEEIVSGLSAALSVLDHYKSNDLPIHSKRRKGAVLNLLIDLRDVMQAWAREQQLVAAAEAEDPANYGRAERRLQELLEEIADNG